MKISKFLHSVRCTKLGDDAIPTIQVYHIQMCEQNVLQAMSFKAIGDLTSHIT